MCYSLRIYSHIPRQRSRSESTLGGGLYDYLGLLPSIKLSHAAIGDPVKTSDVAVIHDFPNGRFNAKIIEIREHSRLVIGVFEFCHNPDYFDRFYTYSQYQTHREHLIRRGDKLFVRIKPPIDKVLYQGLARHGTGILLDHALYDYNYGGDQWINRLWDFFARRSDSVTQLDRAGCVPPKYINIFPVLPVAEYLKRLATFETFIVTHCGSYNHSAKDAAAIGLRVIVPEIGGRPFVPQCLVQQLSMDVVRDEAELANILAQPYVRVPKLECCLHLGDLATEIDEYARRQLDKSMDRQGD